MEESKNEKVAEEKDTTKKADEKAENTSKNADSKEKKPKKKMGKAKKLAILFIVIVILVAVIASVLLLGFSKKTIDMADYLEMEYAGYNGKATASVSIDTKKLGDYLDDSSLAKKFDSKAELSLSKDEEISNGDEIEVTIDISENWLDNNKLKLKDTKVKITVSGIDDANVIDVSKYVIVEYTGLDTNASAKVSLDTDALAEFLEDEDLASTFAKKASLKLDKDSNLTNGDVLIVSISIDDDWLEENGLELKDDEAEIEVEGLEEGTAIDVFEDINISVSGMSPNMKVSVTNGSTDEFVKTVKFTLSKSTGISNGETITITAASWDKDMAEENGYVLESTTMEYTVSADVSYPMSVDELNETSIEAIKTTFIEKAKAMASDEDGWQKIHDNYTDYKIAGDNAGWDGGIWGWTSNTNWELDLTIGTPELCAMYLLSAKDTSDTYNYVYAIYKVTYTSSLTGLNYDWFITVEAKNLSIKSDGSLTENAVYKTYSDNGTTEESAYNAYINDKKENYTVESISY